MNEPDSVERCEINPDPGLSVAVATLRHWASGASCEITPEAVERVLAEYDRLRRVEEAWTDLSERERQAWRDEVHRALDRYPGEEG